MNLEEFIKSAWSPETNEPTTVDGSNKGSSIKLLQSQGSLPSSGISGHKIVDEVWSDVQKQNEKVTSNQVVKREPEPSIGEMTLEDFLGKTATMDEYESSLSPVMSLDIASTSQCFSQQMGLSPVPSIGALSVTPISTWEKDASDNPNRGIEKRLKRKIKNRESAARSRARKQAYHNELVSKVSSLEDLNLRLKKEKEQERRFFSEVLGEPRYQLRRTSSADF